MSEYKEFTGKSVEEALKLAREAFGAELNDIDFEILTPGSRGVLGMGAEPARIVAAPRTALGGARPSARRPPRRHSRPRRPARTTTDPARTALCGTTGRARPTAPRDDRPRDDRPRDDRPRGDRPPRRDDRARRDDRGRAPARSGSASLTASEAAEVAAARGSLAAERADSRRPRRRQRPSPPARRS